MENDEFPAVWGRNIFAHLYMKRIRSLCSHNGLLIVGLVALALVLATGCSKPTSEIEGEVFAQGYEGKIEHIAGADIFLIPAKDEQRFLKFIKTSEESHYAGGFSKWLTNRMRLQNLELHPLANTGRTNRVVVQYRAKFPDDPRSDADITLDLANKFPDEFKTYPDAVADYNRIMGIDEKTALRQELMPDLLFCGEAKLHPSGGTLYQVLDFSNEELMAYLQQYIAITSDSDGKFKIRLPLGTSWVVVAQGRAAKWYFKFTVNGQKLILTMQNALTPNPVVMSATGNAN